MKLREIYVESSVKPQRCSDRRHDLSDQSVQIGVGRALNIEIPAADIVDGLVVDHEGAVGVLQGGVGSQDRVVRFYHSCCNLYST